MSKIGLVLLRAILRLAILVATLACPSSFAAETALPPARDLKVDAKFVEESGSPLIVLVSLAGCPHCEVVRRSYLLPLMRDAVAMSKPTIRQVELNGRELLRDFDGREITHAEFSRRHNVNIAPVLFFLDGTGALLAEPLVGSMIPDFYGAYFDAAFNEAKSKLRSRRTGN